MNINSINSTTPFRGKINLYNSHYSTYRKPAEIDADKITEINQNYLLYKDSDNIERTYKLFDGIRFASDPERTDYYTRFLAAYAAAKVADPDVVIYA